MTSTHFSPKEPSFPFYSPFSPPPTSPVFHFSQSHSSMATNQGFESNQLSTESFSHLLDDAMGLGSFIYPSPPSSSSMLCFETKYRGAGDSLSASSSNNSSSSSSISKSKRNRVGEVNDTQQVVGSIESKKTSKKPKTSNPTTSTKTVKVRKEKLGERITALQQLVSPFGKTDTASVLHEAMGYIRFLHDQVQVLSSPYLQSTHLNGGRRGEEEMMQRSRYDLRSRGLCLVPVECTAHVASSNGADFWSPAAMGNSNRKQ